ncbi:MAG TPA: hypothetical protein PK787_09430, partial [Burkholderiaceae bacterium]|nr:hypothetical protein [Burkholderiaceae bacterium]
IRRIGHERWLRNLAVALGNSGNSGGNSGSNSGGAAIAALRSRADHPSALVREHVTWALRRLGAAAPAFAAAPGDTETGTGGLAASAQPVHPVARDDPNPVHNAS